MCLGSYDVEVGRLLMPHSITIIKYASRIVKYILVLLYAVARNHVLAMVRGASGPGDGVSGGAWGGRTRGGMRKGSPLGRKRGGCPGMFPAGDGFAGFVGLAGGSACPTVGFAGFVGLAGGSACPTVGFAGFVGLAGGSACPTVGFGSGGGQVSSFGSGWASKMGSFGNSWRRRLRRSNSSTARRYLRSVWA